MDINDIRSWYTVVMFVVFIGIVLWAWSGNSKRRFNEAEQLSFNESEYPLEDKNKGDHHE